MSPSIKCICARCGDEFYRYPSTIGKFCSCSCSSGKPKIRCVCQRCGKEFYVYQSHIKKGEGKYCSRQCTSGEKPIDRVCLVCGKTFLEYSYAIKKGRGKYCSHECRHIAISGEGSPTWKGGKSFEPYCIKFNKAFKEKIREKFSRKCYACDKPEAENNGKLAVHHIDYNKNAICNGKEWAFVPLCRKHHGESNILRHYYFNLLINYWAMNPDINFMYFLS